MKLISIRAISWLAMVMGSGRGSRVDVGKMRVVEKFSCIF